MSTLVDKVKNAHTCATYKKRWENAVTKIKEAWAENDPDTIRYYAKVADDYLEKYLKLRYGNE